LEGEEEEDGCPKYQFTKRRGDFTSGNGGWSRDGMVKYNTLYKKVQEDRKTNARAFSKLYKLHRREQMSGQKRKRKNNGGGQSKRLTICDDLGQLLLGAMDSSEGDGTCGSDTVEEI
jgi:hypothetical protein